MCAAWCTTRSLTCGHPRSYSFGAPSRCRTRQATQPPPRRSLRLGTRRPSGTRERARVEVCRSHVRLVRLARRSAHASRARGVHRKRRCARRTKGRDATNGRARGFPREVLSVVARPPVPRVQLCVHGYYRHLRGRRAGEPRRVQHRRGRQGATSALPMPEKATRRTEQSADPSSTVDCSTLRTFSTDASFSFSFSFSFSSSPRRSPSFGSPSRRPRTDTNAHISGVGHPGRPRHRDRGRGGDRAERRRAHRGRLRRGRRVGTEQTKRRRDVGVPLRERLRGLCV